MQVTDEMVQKVARILADDLKEIGLTSESPVANANGAVVPLWTTYMVVARAALTAALSDKQAAEMKIKPLEWARVVGDVEVAGSYKIDRMRPWAGDRPKKYWVQVALGFGSKTIATLCKTVDEAKAAAQADHEQRIRSALVDVPAVEPVGYVNADFRKELSCYDCAELVPNDRSTASFKYIPLYARPPLREGEGSAEAFARITAARKAHVDAVETYNTRLSLVNSERAKGNWSVRVDDEARAMWDAQSAFIKAAQDETDAALAATRSGSATNPKGISE